MRKKYNLTQKELANLIEVDRSTISKWESGELLPNRKNLRKLAEYFRCAESDIVNIILRVNQIDTA